MTTKRKTTRGSSVAKLTNTGELAFFNYSVLVRQEGKSYASWCPELDVASSGDTVEQACENLRDAVACFVDTYAELGELARMLKERGLVPNKEEGCPSTFLSEARISFPSTHLEALHESAVK